MWKWKVVFYVLRAKRDPYRYRFPIVWFVQPNMDHLMFVLYLFEVIIEPELINKKEEKNHCDLRLYDTGM